MKARLVKKLMAISLSLAMLATMAPASAAAAGISGPAASVTRTTETTEKESETKSPQGMTASTEKETKTYKTKLVLPGVTKKTEIKTLSVKQNGKEYKYDSKNLETSDKGELTLKLPANEKGKTTTVVANDITFSGTVTDDDKAELKVAKTTEKETEKTTEKSTEKSTERETEKTTEKATGNAESETSSESESESKIKDGDVTAENMDFGSVVYGEQPVKSLKITNKNTAEKATVSDIKVSDSRFELIKTKDGKTEVVSSVEAFGIEAGKSNEEYSIRPKGILPADESGYSVSVEITYDNGYKAAAALSLKVTKKTLTVTTKAEDREYDGTKDVKVTAELSGAVAGDKAELESAQVTGTVEDGNADEEKTKTVTVDPSKLQLKPETAKNYTIISVPTCSVKITAKKITAKVNEKELETKKVYDKEKTIEAKEGALTLEGVLDTDKEKVKAEGTFEVKSADAGTYTDVSVKDIKLTGDAAKNYTIADTLTHKCEVEIEKADRTAEPKKVNISSYTYNSIKVRAVEGQEYCIVKADDEKTAKKNWKSAKDSYYTFKDLKSSEDYVVFTRVAETKNYKASKEADYEKDEVTTLRNPVVADSSKNTLSGISDNGTYKVSNRITFTATGASTGMSTSSLDDVKYLPKSWSTTSTNTSGTWSSSPYSASFTPTKSGTYTLQVTYKKVKYNGSSWVDQNDDYVKKITYTVNSTGRSTTSSTSSTNSNTKRTTAVKTGDTSPILPLVIVLVVCVGVIGGVGVVSAKKKKQNK